MFRVDVDIKAPTFGPQYANHGPGAIATFGASKYRHRFGGMSWEIDDEPCICSGPSVVVELDLRDPLFAGLGTGYCPTLPLISHMACDVWADPQFYRVEPAKRRAKFLERQAPATESECPELARPFNKRSLSLVPMAAEDLPTSETIYWNASDKFVGGDRFLRILGPPLWLYAPATVHCSCGNSMRYFASMGYPSQRDGNGGQHAEPFIGEGALYWFLCVQCLIMAALSQPT